MNIIEIENLTYSYPAAETPILQNITLQVEKGDFLAIVGNNGCGKSTFCKTLNGLIPHFITGEFSGKVVVDGVNTLEADVGTLAQKAGYVYQDFENQIVRPTVLDDASYACLNYAMADYVERGKEALALCGLKGREDDYIWQLSGGQTHLLALAGAVSLRPEVLILDEPIAQLDPGHADRIYQVLKELNEKHGKTIIVIEHHTEYIADYCKHVMLMRDGNIAWKLPTSQALRRVGELQECNIFPPQVTLAADKLRRQGRLPWEQLLPTTIPQGLEAFRGLAYRPAEQAPSPPPEQEPAPAVEFRQVSLSYRSVKGADRVVFNGLDLTIHKGDKVALIGSNGAGKSTLMKLMVGLLKPASGDIRLNGESIHRKKTEDLSGRFPWCTRTRSRCSSRTPSGRTSLLPWRPGVWSTIRSAPRNCSPGSAFPPLQERDGRLLSGGQMRRASLAIGVALNPGILLLDEPTANLDIATRKEILRTLGEMKDITDTVVIATHDMQLVCEWAQRIVVLLGGKVVADGPRDEIFGNRALLKEVGIRPPEIFSMGQALEERVLCYTVEEFTSCFGEGS